MTPTAAGPPVVIEVAAVGDVLPHRKVKAFAARDGWAAVFGDTGPLLAAADLAFANLESPVAPDQPVPVHDEVFDAPADLPAGLAALGIDVVSMANNHAFDQGPAGITETWTRVRAAGIGTVGAGPDREAATAPWVTEVRGVTIGFVAFCDLSNIDGNTTADAPSVFVSGPLCTADCGPDRDAFHYAIDTDRLVAALSVVRPTVDFLVVSVHWGDEFRTVPLPEYPRLARILVDAGADVILGHHPHVLQPIERVRAADGRDAVVAYSLGNFVSNMAETWTLDSGSGMARTRDSVILRLGLEVWPDGRRTVGAVATTPVWTDNTADHLRVRTHDGMRAAFPGDPAIERLVVSRQAAIDAILTTPLR